MVLLWFRDKVHSHRHAALRLTLKEAWQKQRRTAVHGTTTWQDPFISEQYFALLSWLDGMTGSAPSLSGRTITQKCLLFEATYWRARKKLARTGLEHPRLCTFYTFPEEWSDFRNVVVLICFVAFASELVFVALELRNLYFAACEGFSDTCGTVGPFEERGLPMPSYACHAARGLWDHAMAVNCALQQGVEGETCKTFLQCRSW